LTNHLKTLLCSIIFYCQKPKESKRIAIIININFADGQKQSVKYQPVGMKPVIK
jgi:hypothetical protein